MRRGLVALLVAGVLASACAGPATVALAKSDLPRAAADPAGATDAAAAITAFGLDLYRRSTGSSTGNEVLSPTSIVLALAMARAGAAGTTAAEMDQVLHDVATPDHLAWLNALDAALASRTGTFKDSNGAALPVTLRIANAPFSQRGMTLLPAYLDALATQFGAGVRLVDYRADPEAARAAINAWVKDRTEGRIPELIPAGVIDDNTRLTLTNAIYLKAPWLDPFQVASTTDGPFTRLDGTTVTARFMNGQLEDVRAAAGAGWQAVELPYVGGSLALTIVLPADLATFEAGLDPAALTTITGALAPRTVDLALPKFGIESKVELKDVLSAMGMPTAFTDRADFSGITAEEQLSISAVIHQANIDVDEKGTTAAAATAVVMGRTSLPTDIVHLRLDRPFLFALRDVPTGAILFLGRVTDPTAG